MFPNRTIRRGNGFLRTRCFNRDEARGTSASPEATPRWGSVPMSSYRTIPRGAGFLRTRCLDRDEARGTSTSPEATPRRRSVPMFPY